MDVTLGGVAEASERAQIAGVEQRLTSAFPQLPPADVASTVSAIYAGFASSRVRDFVPLLVEKRAKSEFLGRRANSTAAQVIKD